MALISQPGSEYQITSISLDAGYTRDLILMLIDAHAVLDHLYLDGTQPQITSPADPDLRVAVYSPRNTRGGGWLAPAGWQAGRLTCRLTAPVHRQGFAKAIKDIPGGSRGAMGSTGTCPGHSDDRLPGPRERRSSS